MSRSAWTILLAGLWFAAGADAADGPFGVVSNRCSVRQPRGYSCWYSNVTKKCVCDVVSGGGGGAGGGTTPAGPGVNNEPPNPASNFRRRERSLPASPQDSIQGASERIREAAKRSKAQ